MDHTHSSPPDDRDRDHSFPWHQATSQDLPGWPGDSWVDPLEEHALLRRRIRRYHLGFASLSLGLIVASVSMLVSLILVFGRFGPVGALLGIPRWKIIEQSLVVFPTLLGAFLLAGSWPDKNWQRRSVLLLLMCLVDAVIWGFDHAQELGLSDVVLGHEWLREAITNTIGWSEFALIASLTGDMAAHLGEPRAIDMAKAVRSLATTGAMVWFLFFYFTTNWHAPIWPLQQRGLNHLTLMIYLAWIVLGTINFIQTSFLSLLAGRCCARALREMARQEKAHDLLPSRSEDGWEELNRLSGPKRNG